MRERGRDVGFWFIRLLVLFFGMIKVGREIEWGRKLGVRFLCLVICWSFFGSCVAVEVFEN